MKSNNVRFMFLRDVDGNPHTCVCTRMNYLDGTIEYAIANRPSALPKTRLKRRIQRIQEVGGIVPQDLYKELRALPKNYTKQLARKIATNRLLNYPRKITGLDITQLSSHDVMHFVMKYIAMDDPVFVLNDAVKRTDSEVLNLDKSKFILYGTPHYAVVSARRWIQDNVDGRIASRDNVAVA